MTRAVVVPAVDGLAVVEDAMGRVEDQQSLPRIHVEVEQK